jgi:hypothetical protein
MKRPFAEFHGLSPFMPAACAVAATPGDPSGHCHPPTGSGQGAGKRGAKPCLPNGLLRGAAFAPRSASFDPPVSHPRAFRHQAGGLRCGSTCSNTVPRHRLVRGVLETLGRPSASTATLAASPERRPLPANHRHDRRPAGGAGKRIREQERGWMKFSSAMSPRLQRADGHTHSCPFAILEIVILRFAIFQQEDETSRFRHPRA